MQNLHPLFVHLPLGLLMTAVVAEIAFALTRRPLPDALSRWLLYLGAIGAGIAALSGWLAEQSVTPVAAAAEVLTEHRTLGFLTLGNAAMLAFWRWGTARAGGPRPRSFFLACMLGLGALLYAASHEGGELVYEHGVGTTLTAPGGPLHQTPADSLRRPARDVPQRGDFR